MNRWIELVMTHMLPWPIGVLVGASALSLVDRLDRPVVAVARAPLLKVVPVIQERREHADELRRAPDRHDRKRASAPVHADAVHAVAERARGGAPPGARLRNRRSKRPAPGRRSSVASSAPPAAAKRSPRLRHARISLKPRWHCASTSDAISRPPNRKRYGSLLS